MHCIIKHKSFIKKVKRAHFDFILPIKTSWNGSFLSCADVFPTETKCLGGVFLYRQCNVVYVTAVKHYLLHGNVIQWQVELEGHFQSREHLIGNKICVIQDKSSLLYFWFMFLQKRKTVHIKSIYRKHYHMANLKSNQVLQGLHIFADHNLKTS